MNHPLSKFDILTRWWPKTWPRDSLFQRLPKHYLLRKLDAETRKPIPVHWKPIEKRFKIDKYGMKVPIYNIPLNTFHPKAADKGLWGGEEPIKSYITNRYIRIPKVWVPKILQHIYYSEILDKHMLIQVTQRTMDLIDESYGFDHYILKTHEVDLKSKLGMDLKREMLIQLFKKDFYPNDQIKQETLFARYKKYLAENSVNSLEEAEWIGLSFEEAYEKQLAIEKREKGEPIPLKYHYMKDLLAKYIFPQETDTSTPENKPKLAVTG